MPSKPASGADKPETAPTDDAAATQASAPETPPVAPPTPGVDPQDPVIQAITSGLTGLMSTVNELTGTVNALNDNVGDMADYLNEKVAEEKAAAEALEQKEDTTPEPSQEAPTGDDVPEGQELVDSPWGPLYENGVRFFCPQWSDYQIEAVKEHHVTDVHGRQSRVQGTMIKFSNHVHDSYDPEEVELLRWLATHPRSRAKGDFFESPDAQPISHVQVTDGVKSAGPTTRAEPAVVGGAVPA